jgi:hypothetical protein
VLRLLLPLLLLVLLVLVVVVGSCVGDAATALPGVVLV